MKKLVIVDGNNVLFRAFYGLPLLSNSDGVYCNAVYGFINMIIKIIKDSSPDYFVVAFDCDKKNFRHEIFKEYKGTRKEVPSELAPQFDLIRKFLDVMKIKYLEVHGIEADDIIGILTKKFDCEKVIVTNDKDCFQLIDENTSVLCSKKGVTDVELLDLEMFRKKFLIEPLQIIDLKALMGDPSDNIPGVKGIGEKTANTLLKEFNNLDNIYSNIDLLKKKTQTNLIDYKDNAYMSKKLATIIRDYDLNYDLEDFSLKFPFSYQTKELFKSFQFYSLIKKDELFEIPEGALVEAKQKSILIDDVDEFIDILKFLKDEFAFYFLDNNFYFSVDNDDYTINFTDELLAKGFSIKECLKHLKSIFKNELIKKITFNSKDILHFLHDYKIEIKNLDFDCALARYVLNCGKGQKTNASISEVLIENGLNENTVGKSLLDLYKIQNKLIEEFGLKMVYYGIELPLVNVLFEMELSGIKIDTNVTKMLDSNYDVILNNLTNDIYALAGAPFNINSPKQVMDVLFNKLMLIAPRNKKLSSDILLLKEIEGQHPIIAKIIEYRKISKLSGTYIKSFLNLVDKENKIHTVYNQMITSTGRLSSSEPNLQNIPVRSEDGKAIRKMFVPSFENGYIVSADYSQIELRLLANFSKDPKLLDSFNTGCDIHARTASEIFNVPIDLVTPEMRRSAKAINFGIIYGISEYGLSESLGCGIKTAKEYIAKYFENYPKVDEYMKCNVMFSTRNGFGSTYFGRIRYIPELASSNYNIRSFGERASKNLPLQGTASDIIKLAMVRVDSALKFNELKSKLILQIHDELIIDTSSDELIIVSAILHECMEHIIKGRISLNVNVEYGRNWGDIK